MKKLLFVLIVATMLSGCEKDAESTTQVGNGINLEKLFTQGDCTMYRFHDEGRTIYWSDCSGQTQYLAQSSKSYYRVSESTNSPVDRSVDRSVNRSVNRYEVP